LEQLFIKAINPEPFLKL